MYSYEFTLSVPGATSATMDFHIFADDYYGDQFPFDDGAYVINPNPSGVYINGIPTGIFGNGFLPTCCGSSPSLGIDVFPMLNLDGTPNRLEIYILDAFEVAAGVIFSAEITAVPEPSAVWLLAPGLAVLAALRRARRPATAGSTSKAASRQLTG